MGMEADATTTSQLPLTDTDINWDRFGFLFIYASMLKPLTS